MTPEEVEREKQKVDALRRKVSARERKKGRREEREYILNILRTFQNLINRGHVIRIGEIVRAVEDRAFYDHHRANEEQE